MSTLEAQLTLIEKPPPRARPRAALLDPESAAMWHHHLDIETGPVGSIAVLHLAAADHGHGPRLAEGVTS